MGEMLRVYAASAAEVRSLVLRAGESKAIAERLAATVRPHLDDDVAPGVLDELLSGERLEAGEDPTPRWRALETVIAATAWAAGATGPYNRSWLPDFDRQLARGGVPADLRLESLMELAGLPGLDLRRAPTGVATVLPAAAADRLVSTWAAARERMTEPDVTDDVLAVARQVTPLAERAATLGRPAPDLILVFGGAGPHAELGRPERWADHVRRAAFEPERLAGVPETELGTYAFADGPDRQYILQWRFTNGDVSARWQTRDAAQTWDGQLAPAWGAQFEQAMAATRFPTPPADPGPRNFLLRFGAVDTGREVVSDVDATRADPAWARVLGLLDGAIATLCGREVNGARGDRSWLEPLQ